MRDLRGLAAVPLFFLSSLFVFALIPTTYAGESPAAEAFSDPSYVITMKPGWDDNPVEYTESRRQADVSIIINQQLSAVFLPIVEGFSRENDIKLFYEIGTCGISAGALSRKEVDMGGFCCPPGEMDRLPGLRFHTLGITPLLLIVDKDNPVDNVSLDEARALFEGRITNWSELGGKDMPVRPMGMLHCKKRPGHWRLILGSSDQFSPEFNVTGDIEDTIRMVSQTPGSIGFEIMMNIIKLDAADKLKVLRIDNHDPMDMARLRSGKYPFYRTMNITTWDGRNTSNPRAVELKDYMMRQTRIVDRSQGILPAEELRRAGWKFRGDELTGGLAD